MVLFKGWCNYIGKTPYFSVELWTSLYLHISEEIPVLHLLLSLNLISSPSGLHQIVNYLLIMFGWEKDFPNDIMIIQL